MSSDAKRLFVIHATTIQAELIGHSSFVTSFYLVAVDEDEAREKATNLKVFETHQLRLESVQEVHMVEGYRVELSHQAGRDGQTLLKNYGKS